MEEREAIPAGGQDAGTPAEETVAREQPHEEVPAPNEPDAGDPPVEEPAEEDPPAEAPPEQEPAPEPPPIEEPPAEEPPAAESSGEPQAEPEPTPEEPTQEPEESAQEPEELAQEEVAAEPILSEQVTAEDLLGEPEPELAPASTEDTELKAVLEAIIYVADDPLSLVQVASALGQPRERVEKLIHELMDEFEQPWHGIAIREVAGGFKMTTKPEHHEGVRSFVKSLKPPLKLSLPALETLAVIAYKQPVTGPEIMEVRGVQGAGVLKTLLDRKLIAVAGRKNVIGKPMLYKTTKEFLVQFGLKDLSELPSLKEFEEIRRLAMSDSEPVPAAEPAAPVEEPPVPSPPAAAEEAVPEQVQGNEVTGEAQEVTEEAQKDA